MTTQINSALECCLQVALAKNCNQQKLAFIFSHLQNDSSATAFHIKPNISILMVERDRVFIFSCSSEIQYYLFAGCGWCLLRKFPKRKKPKPNDPKFKLKKKKRGGGEEKRNEKKQKRIEKRCIYAFFLSCPQVIIILFFPPILLCSF